MAEKKDKKPAAEGSQEDTLPKPPAKEIGGPKGPEPTRFGDWERKGIVSDF
ncbi:MAG: succinate dehydrogenase assembly factor 4 [Sphingomonadales bacterium]